MGEKLHTNREELRVDYTLETSGEHRKFSWGGGFHSVAYGGHLYLVWAVCDVTISRHKHVFKPAVWRSLLT